MQMTGVKSFNQVTSSAVCLKRIQLPFLCCKKIFPCSACRCRTLAAAPRIFCRCCSILNGNNSLFTPSIGDLTHAYSKDEQFLSVTIFGDEITVVTNSSLLEQMITKSAFEINSNHWSCIQISAGPSIGILSSIFIWDWK